MIRIPLAFLMALSASLATAQQSAIEDDLAANRKLFNAALDEVRYNKEENCREPPRTECEKAFDVLIGAYEELFNAYTELRRQESLGDKMSPNVWRARSRHMAATEALAKAKYALLPHTLGRLK